MTSAGLEMLARAASGQTADRFIVTKVKLGDGVSSDFEKFCAVKGR